MTDYDIEDHDMLSSERLLDSMFSNKIEVRAVLKQSADTGDSDEDTVEQSIQQDSDGHQPHPKTFHYEILKKPDVDDPHDTNDADAYTEEHHRRIDYQHHLAMEATDSKARLESVRSLLNPGVADKVCLMSLKTMGIRKIAVGKRQQRGASVSSSSDEESTVLSKGPTKEGLRFLATKEDNLDTNLANVIAWENTFLDIARNHSTESFNDPKEKRTLQVSNKMNWEKLLKKRLRVN